MGTVANQYITADQFSAVLDDLSYQEDDTTQQELLDRATADLESDLSQRFVVPLVSQDTGAYADAPSYARNRVLNMLKEKIREIIGYDKNKNLVGTIESTEKFINVHQIQYKEFLKGMLDPKIIYNFLMQTYAQNAIVPVQYIALSRADDETNPTGELSPRAGYGL